MVRGNWSDSISDKCFCELNTICMFLVLPSPGSPGLRAVK